VRRGKLIEHLEPLLAARGTSLDHAQVAAVERLQTLASELAAFRAARQSTLKKIFAPPDVPRGVYLWGGVGRGKSLLMDAFFATVGIRRKTRVHFHAFMRDVHEELARLKNETDPLAAVAARIAKRWRLVCFDEFHVSDIADAMILGRLFTALFTHGVVFVLTSNYPPDGLWPNGLQRERFLPAIALLKEWLDAVEVDAGIDYRLRVLEQAGTYHTPLGPETDAELDRAFERMRSGPDESAHLTIEGRTLIARKRAGSAVWFDFAALCDGPRSQRDYLELARSFPVVFLSGVPRMSTEMGDRARRFTWLVDILYDHRVKLLMAADGPPEELYREGPNSQDFPRTVSRLVEMQTHDYMAQPHVAAEAAAAPA
jgi:cell division protein ZapE